MTSITARTRRAARAGWSAVPERVRSSRPVAALRRRVRGSTAAPEQIVVRTMAELDAMLHDLDHRALVSDDEVRAGFARYRMDAHPAMPADPFSEEYRAAVFDFFTEIHGRPYDVAFESTPFDHDDAVVRPFPYSTRSPGLIGNQLMAIGHIVKVMDLPAGATVLDLGPGWGNTALALAQSGYDVTAIDIDPGFVELIGRRAERLGVAVDVVRGDFSVAATLGRRFDAVLFYECFHHSADHVGLLRSLDEVVAPGGKLVFAAEPITDDLPYPWGLRLDGESLFQIRRRGWLELGFRESYFRDLLSRLGWTLSRHECRDTPWGVVYVATRR